MTDNDTWLTVVACVGWLAFVVAWMYADAVAGVADRCITMLEACRIDQRSAESGRDMALLHENAGWEEADRLAALGNEMVEARDKQIAKLRWRLAERGETPRDIPRAGLPFMHLEYAARMRLTGWSKLAHANVINACAIERERTHTAGQGVP